VGDVMLYHSFNAAPGAVERRPALQQQLHYLFVLAAACSPEDIRP
jgi:hypothetical protein